MDEGFLEIPENVSMKQMAPLHLVYPHSQERFLSLDFQEESRRSRERNLYTWKRNISTKATLLREISEWAVVQNEMKLFQEIITLLLN